MIRAEASPQSPLRRRVLNRLLALSSAAALGWILYPVLRYLSPMRVRSQGGPVPVPADQMGAVHNQPHFTILRAAEKRLIVFQDASQEVRALSAICTHEGCTVQFLEGEQIIWCACHNGRFDLDGRVLSGPPPRPLRQYALLHDEDGSMRVSLEDIEKEA